MHQKEHVKGEYNRTVSTKIEPIFFLYIYIKYFI